MHRKVRSAKAPEEERQRSPHSARTCTSIRRNKHGTGQGIGMTPELNNGACIAPKFVLTDPQLLTRRHRRGGDIVIIDGYPSPELRGLREQFRAGAAIEIGRPSLGTERVCPCSSRVSPYYTKKNK